MQSLRELRVCVALSIRDYIRKPMMSPINIASRSYEGLSAGELDHWRSLAETPLQTPEWLISWWEAFRSDNASPQLLLATQAGELIGLLPLVSRNCWSFGRVLKFAGSGIACTDFQTLLSAPQHAAALADAVADWLIVGPGRGTWDVLELEGLSPDAMGIELLLKRLKEDSTIQQTTHLENTWRLDVANGWNEFQKNVSKSQRAQNRNLINRFEKNAELQFRIASNGPELTAAIDRCAELHQLRWNAVGQRGSFSDRRFTQFVHRGIQALSGYGRAEVALLERQGEAIAAQLILKDHRQNRFVYQSGRDPQYDSQRVGQLLTLLGIRHATEHGAQFVDYLRGNELYKSRLKAVPSDCRRIRVFAPGILPKLRYGAWCLNHQLKKQADRWSGWTSSSHPGSAPAENN